MGKKSRRQSIKKDFVVYIILYILLSLLLGFLSSRFFQQKQNQIRQKYQAEYEKTMQNLEGHKGTLYRDDIQVEIRYTVDIVTFFTPYDLIKYDILGVSSGAVYPVSFIVCLILTSILFYKKTLQKPLELLGSAADKIAGSNLDFEIHYDRQDELGRLCLSFEKMRRALRDNNLELWRQIEERRRLNAAFAHDLRTPLTVLKGQSEMLVKYTPNMSEEKIIETAEMMRRHIARLENYVDTMNTLQRLEDIELHRQAVDKTRLFRQLKETGTCICADKTFIFEDMPQQSEPVLITIDAAVIMQVYENLLSNAIRYARRQILVSACITDGFFRITVSDDGAGFSDKDLLEATKPFYKASKETDSEHFGMGLNICKALCEKHGGFLTLQNKDGAVVTAVFRAA
ncbi:MAG: HAMP domain-containing histidine kinase [Lachnospiraceae bacterium]|nr:HAMP domain-containing histidine kinase [Lachnospiraceae bacterium]